MICVPCFFQGSKSSILKQGVSHIWANMLFGDKLFLILAALNHVK